MICISVILCLSSGLAKNNKLMSMFVLFSRLFRPFRKFGFFSKMGRQTVNQNTPTGCFYFENTTAKKHERRRNVDFLFERANILSKKPARKICSKIKKKPTFWDKPWRKSVKISHFLGQSWDHQSSYWSILGLLQPVTNRFFQRRNTKCQENHIV